MATFVKLTTPDGKDVYVNPDHVLYVRAHSDGGGFSTLYLTSPTKDKSTILELKGDVATVVKALESPN
jgi:hypothetical protein